ncbi:MAG: hypothetical protein HAW62_00585 [Endozoicomonadaceae bacterium]|nr:hypothetical protein [Endozoicomonadaceae bacterium]
MLNFVNPILLTCLFFVNFFTNISVEAGRTCRYQNVPDFDPNPTSENEALAACLIETVFRWDEGKKKRSLFDDGIELIKTHKLFENQNFVIVLIQTIRRETYVASRCSSGFNTLNFLDLKTVLLKILCFFSNPTIDIYLDEIYSKIMISFTCMNLVSTKDIKKMDQHVDFIRLLFDIGYEKYGLEFYQIILQRREQYALMSEKCKNSPLFIKTLDKNISEQHIIKKAHDIIETSAFPLPGWSQLQMLTKQDVNLNIIYDMYLDLIQKQENQKKSELSFTTQTGQAIANLLTQKIIITTDLLKSFPLNQLTDLEKTNLLIIALEKRQGYIYQIFIHHDIIPDQEDHIALVMSTMTDQCLMSTVSHNWIDTPFLTDLLFPLIDKAPHCVSIANKYKIPVAAACLFSIPIISQREAEKLIAKEFTLDIPYTTQTLKTRRDVLPDILSVYIQKPVSIKAR